MNIGFHHEIMNHRIEYSFTLPIQAIFYQKWDVESIDNLKVDTSIIDRIAKLLDVRYNRHLIEDNYWKETNNVEVFHGKDVNDFLFFDLVIDPYDQCNMVFFGVGLDRKYEKQILDLMLELYYKSGGPCSDLTIDYFNKSLHHVVLSEDFYFYKSKIYEGRKLIHHFS